MEICEYLTIYRINGELVTTSDTLSKGEYVLIYVQDRPGFRMVKWVNDLGDELNPSPQEMESDRSGTRLFRYQMVNCNTDLHVVYEEEVEDTVTVSVIGCSMGHRGRIYYPTNQPLPQGITLLVYPTTLASPQDPQTSVERGSSVTVEVVEDVSAQYTFSKWQNYSGNVTFSTSNPYTFQADNNALMVAFLVPKTN